MWWQVQSRNKLSVALDLKDEASRSVVLKLIGEVDVLVENFRPGLVMLRISGYGQTGPYTDRPGFGVVAEAMGGLRHLTAEPGRVPVRVGVSIGDTLASLHGVIGILIALQHRQASVSIDAPKGRSAWPCTRPSAQRGRRARCAEGREQPRAHAHHSVSLATGTALTPNEKRFSDRIETDSVDSVFSWLNRSGLGAPARAIR